MKHCSIAILLFSLTLSTRVHSQCLTDQLWTDSYLYTTEYVAQSFQTCASGNVEAIDFYIHNLLTGDMTVKMTIHDGPNYTDPVIHSDQFIVSDGWGGLNTYTFTSDLWLIEGQDYCMKFDFDGFVGAVWVALTDVYEDGILHYGVDEMPHMDLGFRVHMPAPPIPPCLMWNGSQNSDWENAQNWTPEVVPDSTQCVTIPEVDSGVYPDIDQKAEMWSLTVEEHAMLDLQDAGQIDIYGGLTVNGECDLRGDVVMMNRLNAGFISGGVAFNRLKVHDILFLMEPISVRDLLDLSEGSIINFGTEVTVYESESHKGHVYAPESNFAGHLTYVKEYNTSGAQLFSVPMINQTLGQIMDSTGLEVLSTFQEGDGISDFHSLWTEAQDPTEDHQLMQAYMVETEMNQTLTIEGEISTEDHSLLGSESHGEAAGDWKFIANPYPSILDWKRVSDSPHSTKAFYTWNDETQQFNSYVDGIYTHSSSTRIRPMEGFFIRMPASKQVRLDYNSSIVLPDEIYDEPLEESIYNPLLRLKVTSISGEDLTVVSLDPNATGQAEPNKDAYKIPSLNNEQPTLGSISNEGYVLSINRLMPQSQNGVVPLYFTAGVEGPVVFLAELIENFSGNEDIFLEDRKTGNFHNLFDNGSYTTYFDSQDAATRFFLHFGYDAQSNAHVPVAGEEPPRVNAPIMHGFENQVHVIASPQEPLLPNTSVEVYSMNGSLVYSDVLSVEEERLIIHTHVSPGYYIVRVFDGQEEHIEKIKLD